MGLKVSLRLFIKSFRSDIADCALRALGRGHRSEMVAKIEGSPGVVLDLCTGVGSQLVAYAERFPDAVIITLDREPQILQLVRSRLRDKGFTGISELEAEASDIPLADASVDLVNVSYGLHENKREERARILAEAWRVLKPGGQLVLCDYREVTGGLKGAFYKVYLRLFEPPWVDELFGEGLLDQVRAVGFRVRIWDDKTPFTQFCVAVKV